MNKHVFIALLLIGSFIAHSRAEEQEQYRCPDDEVETTTTTTTTTTTEPTTTTTEPTTTTTEPTTTTTEPTTTTTKPTTTTTKPTTTTTKPTTTTTKPTTTTTKPTTTTTKPTTTTTKPTTTTTKPTTTTTKPTTTTTKPTTTRVTEAPTTDDFHGGSDKPNHFDIAHFLKELDEEIRDYIKALKISGMDIEDSTVLTNKLVDRILLEFGQAADLSLNPFLLPDFNQGFDYKFGFLSLYGRLILTDGKAYNLSSVERLGSVKIEDTLDGINTTINFNFKELPFKFRYSAKLYGLGPSGHIVGKVKSLRSRLILTIDPLSWRLIEGDFELTNRGEIEWRFKGESLIEWVLNLIKRIFDGVIKKIVNVVSTRYITDSLGDIIKEINKVVNEIILQLN